MEEYQLLRNGLFVAARLFDPSELPRPAEPDAEWLGENVREWLQTFGVVPGAVNPATDDVTVVFPAWSGDVYQICREGASWLPREAWTMETEGLAQ